MQVWQMVRASFLHFRGCGGRVELRMSDTTRVEFQRASFTNVEYQ